MVSITKINHKNESYLVIQFEDGLSGYIDYFYIKLNKLSSDNPIFNLYMNNL